MAVTLEQFVQNLIRAGLFTAGDPGSDREVGLPNRERGQRLTVRSRQVLFLAVCCLGISSLITQLTLMRELLSVFSGNELVFGIVLGNWLLLTGIGSALGKTVSRLKEPLSILVLAQILVAVLPIADVFLLRTLRNIVFMRGAAVGMTETVASCFVLLLPYCVIAGYLLTLACLILASEKGPASIGQVYFLDNIGDIMGGLLFSFVLIRLFDHFGILYVPALLNLLFAGLVAALFKRRLLLAAAVAVTLGLVGLVLTCDLDDVSARIQYAGQRVVYKGNSPYGSLIVTETAGQYNFIENGVVLFSTHNIKEVEETVHYAMAQRPNAQRVLLISGGVSGTAREILKHGVAAVDYVELDPLIIEVAQQYLPESLADYRINVINTDGRLFVKQTDRNYDVVIADLPDPSTSQINRFYTQEFFKEVKRTLTPDGVVCFSLGHYENYLSKELANLIAVAHRTLKQEFNKVLIIPAGQIFFLASDGPLITDIATRLEEKGIHARWLRRPYLSDVLKPFRLQGVRRAISEDAPVNKDFSPILYYYDLLYWIREFEVSFGFLEVGLLLIFLIFLLRIRSVSFAIFTTGFAASALEVVLLVGFQILCGCVYHQVGLIVTMFMLGLGVGSYIMNRMLPRWTRKDLAKLEFGIAAYAACLPLVLTGLGHVGGAAGFVAPQVVIPLLTFVLAVLVGMEFPLAGKADFHAVASTAGRLYTADLVGASLGALLVSTILIPLLGVAAVCYLSAALNAAGGLVILATSRTSC
jgi:spermidine synthase